MEEKSPKKRITRESLRNGARILSYIKPYRGTFALGLFALLVSSLTSLLVFGKMGDIIDLSETNFMEKSLYFAGLFGIILGVQALASYVRIHTFAIVTENSIANIRRDVYHKLIRLPMRYFSEKRVGELSSQISADIASIKDSLTTYVAEFIRQIVTIVGVIAILSSTSIRLALFMLATLPLMALFAVFFGRYVRRISKKTQKSVGEANTIVEETLQGITAVKAFSGELLETVRYNRITNDIIKLGMKYAVLRGIFASTIVVLIFGSVLAIVWYGSFLVAEGEITSGQFFNFFILSGFMAGSVGGLADTYSQIQKALGATENVLHILDQEPELKETLIPRNPEKFLQGKIEFRDVHFSYPSRNDFAVLKGVSFSIQPGEQLAIVGPSGAGKSTLTNLLLRFYEPSGGTIYVDDKLIESYELANYRSQLAYVPQDIVLFGGTILENIRYGKPTATDEEVMEAAKKANAHEFIAGFPEQYATVVGERGTKLSGGQRQRVAIARALLSDPAILVLDEATSSLDSESEKLVQDALDTLMKGRTTLVIAHRLSTVKNADKIVVLDQGKIRESGSHEELKQLEGGLYRYLVSLQYEVL